MDVIAGIVASAELHAGAACLVARDPAVADTPLATAPYSAPGRTPAVRLLGEMQHCLRRR